MKVNICASLVSLPAFVVANVRDNVRLQYLQDCCYYMVYRRRVIVAVGVYCRVGVKNSTCTWYLYLSTYLSVLDVLEYLVYGNVKVLVLVLDQKVLGTYK